MVDYRRLVLSVVLALVACAGASATPPNPSLFSYDASRPLAVQFGEREAFQGIVREHLTFDAGYGERVSAIYVHADRGGPWPVVLFSPGQGGDENDQLPDANRLVSRGIASLTVAPPPAVLTCNAAADVRTYAQYVIGRRRALDLISQLDGADATRLAAVGFSFGSAVTGTLVGVDHRLRAAVIQSGRAHHSVAVARACTHLGRRRLAEYVAAVSVVDPVKYVGGAAPTALLFENGTQDVNSPRADVDAYVKAASAPKERRSYKAGHGLNAAAFAYRDAWLVRHLLG